jgi:hypothetical protein
MIKNGYAKHEAKAVPWLGRGRGGSRRPLIADARVRSQGSSCGIRGGQSGNGQILLLLVRCLLSVSIQYSVLTDSRILQERVILVVDSIVK